MKLHGKFVLCICGIRLAFVRDLVRQRGRGKYFNLSKFYIFYDAYRIHESEERKIKCTGCGNQIGKRRLYSEDLILIPSTVLKQAKNSVYIDTDNKIVNINDYNTESDED